MRPPLTPALVLLMLALAGCPKPDAAKPASAMGGSAVCQIANCNYTIIPTGSGWTKSNWNIP